MYNSKYKLYIPVITIRLQSVHTPWSIQRNLLNLIKDMDTSLQLQGTLFLSHFDHNYFVMFLTPQQRKFPMVSVIEGFHCIFNFVRVGELKLGETLHTN